LVAKIITVNASQGERNQSITSHPTISMTLSYGLRKHRRNRGLRLFALCWAISALVVATIAGLASADNHAVADGNESMVVALGGFWSAEQALEQYAPGVVEVVIGYAGGTNNNPTYRNHPGHYEVVLIEYDPHKTSYEVLLNYAYRNMDPFDGTGQFCDKGSSYYPAVFYQTEYELELANDVLAEILELKGWNRQNITASILKRPTFWKVEKHHQDYYVKNPSQYENYKNECRRTQRLKEVWGLFEYTCYHDEEYPCFFRDEDEVEFFFDDDTTLNLLNATNGRVPVVINAHGEVVIAENTVEKKAPEKESLPPWAVFTIAVVGPMVVTFMVLFVANRCRAHTKKTDQWKVERLADQQKMCQGRFEEWGKEHQQQPVEQQPTATMTVDPLECIRVDPPDFKRETTDRPNIKSNPINSN